MNRRLMFDGVSISIIPCSLLSSGNGSAVIIYGVLQKMSRDAKAYPSYDELQRRSGLSRKTVSASIKWLEKTGWISIKHRFNTSSIYTIYASGETTLTVGGETTLTQCKNGDSNVLEDITTPERYASDVLAVWSRIENKLYQIPWSGVPIVNPSSVSRGTVGNLKRFFCKWLYNESKAFSDFDDYMRLMKEMYSSSSHPFQRECASTLKRFCDGWEHYAPMVKAFGAWKAANEKVIEFPDEAAN